MSNLNFNELLEKGKTYFANMSTKKKIIVGVIILLLIGVGLNDEDEKANPKPTKNNQAAVTSATSENTNPPSETVTIFKDYTYGMSPEQVKQKSKATPCDNPDFPTALCTPKPVKFADTEWDQMFCFTDGKLEQVALARDEIDLEELLALNQQLAQNEFFPVYMNNGIETFDNIDSIKKIGAENAWNESMKYVNDSMQNAQLLKVYFFPISYVMELVEENASSAFAKIADAPKDLRAIELTMTEDGVAVVFEAALPFIKKLNKKRAKESF